MDSARFDLVIAALHEHGNASRALRDNGVPRHELYEHIKGDDEAANRYARAKREGIEAQAENLLDIADDMTVPHEHKRIQVDARKFLLSKLVPKVYGDKLELDAKVSVGDAIVERLAKARKGES